MPWSGGENEANKDKTSDCLMFEGQTTGSVSNLLECDTHNAQIHHQVN